MTTDFLFGYVDGRQGRWDPHAHDVADVNEYAAGARRGQDERASLPDGDA